MAGLVTAVRRAEHTSRRIGQSRVLAGERREDNAVRGDPQITGSPCDDDLVSVSSVLSGELTVACDEAQRALRIPADQILLAALGRTIACTRGEGVAAVDLAGHGRLVLKPDVDLHRTVGWFTTVYPIPLDCATEQTASATELLDGVHRSIDAVPHYGIGHGLLR